MIRERKVQESPRKAEGEREREREMLDENYVRRLCEEVTRPAETRLAQIYIYIYICIFIYIYIYIERERDR